MTQSSTPPIDGESANKAEPAVHPAAIAAGKQSAQERRKVPRTRLAKVGKILQADKPPVACTVLDTSVSGAVLEAQNPVEEKKFDLVFDDREWPRRSCRVVWVNGPRIGVEFLTMGTLLDGYDAARQQRDAQVAERHRKEDVIDRELHEVVNQMSEAEEFLRENEIVAEIVNRTLRIAHKRAPVISIHYDPEEQNYATTFMPDGSHETAKSSEECVKSIGGMLFTVLRHG